MTQTRKRSAARSPTPVEPAMKKRYSARLSDEQKEQLRKAVLYLAPRFPDKPYTHLGIFDEVRALIGLEHLNVVLRKNFSRWLKENKDGEWERMKEQAERDGRETYFADLIELDGGDVGNTDDDEPQPRKSAKKLTNEEKLAIAKAVLYLAPRTVGGRCCRYKNTGQWQPNSRWLYPVVKELLGLEQTSESLLKVFRCWLKENKTKWQEMKAQSELQADYFGELIDCEDDLIRQGVIDDTRPAPVPSESGGGDEAQRSRYAGPPPSPSRPEPSHFANAKRETGEHDDSGSTLLCYDVSRDDDAPAFDGADGGDERAGNEGEEADQATGGGATTAPVIVQHHHHHHVHYIANTNNYYGSASEQGAHFPLPQQ